MSGVAATIARERNARELTLDELARRASVAAGLLSELERGIGNPSLNTLVSIANALEVPLGTFFEGPNTDGDIVVRAATRRHLVLSDQQVTYQLLVPNLQSNLSMVYVELPPGFTNEAAPFQHPGEEAELVLKGRVEVHLGDRLFLLKEGDSTRFVSSAPHWYRTFETGCAIVSAMTPPSF